MSAESESAQDVAQQLAEQAEQECTCFWVDPKHWFTYYGAAEPGSQMEPNPDCSVHFAPHAKQGPPHA